MISVFADNLDFLKPTAIAECYAIRQGASATKSGVLVDFGHSGH